LSMVFSISFIDKLSLSSPCFLICSIFMSVEF
jgi:hypothetical protein